MPDESFTRTKSKVGYSSADSYSVLLDSCKGLLRPSITSSKICRGASERGIRDIESEKEK